MSVGSPPPAKPERKGDWAVHVALGAAIIIAGAWLFGGVAPEWLNAKAIASLDLLDRKSTRLNSSHIQKSRMPSSA